MPDNARLLITCDTAFYAIIKDKKLFQASEDNPAMEQAVEQYEDERDDIVQVCIQYLQIRHIFQPKIIDFLISTGKPRKFLLIFIFVNYTYDTSE